MDFTVEVGMLNRPVIRLLFEKTSYINIISVNCEQKVSVNMVRILLDYCRVIVFDKDG